MHSSKIVSIGLPDVKNVISLFHADYESAISILFTAPEICEIIFFILRNFPEQHFLIVNFLGIVLANFLIHSLALYSYTSVFRTHYSFEFIA